MVVKIFGKNHLKSGNKAAFMSWRVNRVVQALCLKRYLKKKRESKLLAPCRFEALFTQTTPTKPLGIFVWLTFHHVGNQPS